MNTYNLAEIREQYLNDEDTRDFGQYLTENYTKTYDNELNFIGYYRSVNND